MRIRAVQLFALLCLSAGLAFGQSVTLVSANNPSTVGDQVSLTASFTGNALFSGEVEVDLRDGASDGPAIDSTSANFTAGAPVSPVSFGVFGLSQGVHSLFACYNTQSPSSVQICSPPLSQVVNTASSTFILTTTPNPSAIGQAVTLIASGTPSFTTVTFLDGGPNGVALGSAFTSGGGTVSIQVSTLASGLHQLIACYPTDPSPFCSNTVNQVVSFGPTSLRLTSSQNPSGSCQSVTFTATITPDTATGSVTFFDSTTILAMVPVTAGTASYTTTSLALGDHLIQARFVPDAAFGASSALLQQTVKGAANITLNIAPNPSNSGQNVVMTAAVTIAPCADAPPPTAAATGSVSFFDGATQIGQANLTSGTATFQTATLTVGSHNVNAVYSGDGNFGPNTSTTVVQVVNPVVKSNTATTLSPSANPIASGQPVTLTATVASTATPPSSQTITGQVQFRDGGNVIGTGTVSNGTAIFTASGLTTGSHSLSAFYVGDSNFNSSTSNTVNETVNTPSTSTTTALAVSPNPAVVGQAVTLSATVTPAGATGSVQFLDGSAPVGQATVSGGAAALSVSTFTAGTHTITARYLGDTVNSPSTSNAVILTVNPVKQNSTTSLTVSSNPVTSGQALTLTAVVGPPGATGTVQFTDGGSPIGSANLNNGTASLTTSTLAVGPHLLAASYSGDAGFNPSVSQSITETVVRATNPTTTSLSVNPISSVFGQTVVLNVSVTGAGGTPTGTVTFSDGSTILTVTTIVNGAASLSTSTLTVGAHSLSASYSGDNSFDPSSANPVSVQVTKATTITALSASPTSSTPGQAVALSAKVTSTTGVTLTGTVTFFDGTAALGAPVALTNGSASMTISTLANGTHTLTAVYSGEENFQGSTSLPVSVSVGLTQTATTLTANPTSPALGQSVTFTASVTPAGATGSVTFQDGGNTLGSGTLDSSGTATFTTTSLTSGNHSVTAVYAGDAKFATSTSSAVPLSIPKGNSTIVLSATPNPGTVGQAVTLRAVVTPASATGTVTFLDGGAPLGSATLNNGVATIATSTLVLGNHNLTASYPGDTSSNGSTSAPVTEVIGTGTTTPPLANILPGALPTGIVGIPYSQSFSVTGGTLPLTWTLAAGSVPGLTLSPAGVLSGTPTAAGTTSLTVRVQDNANVATASVVSLTVLPLPAPTLSVPTISTPADQPAPQFTLSPAYPLPLIGTFTLTFTPSASGLPANYVNPDVKFASGGIATGNIPIPANSTAPVALPAVQSGSVAGTVTIRLSSLVTSTGQSVLPADPVIATIVVNRLAPVIVPGSVKIINITSTGFSVFLDGSSTPRDLTSASLTFTAATGAQLNGAQATVSLTAASAAWFADTSAGRGVANGGSFSLTIPFAYSGDTSAIGTVSVTLTNSVGTSAAVTGGR